MDLTIAERRPDMASVICRFRAEDACFHDHFPGNPVVPGSLIVGISLYTVLTAFTGETPLRISRFSFLRPARPGEGILHIRVHEHGFSCHFEQLGALCAKGTIQCG